ncbi:hypothetical protein VNO77_43460 [Canavalia gladiata]|uniref:Uncharacterized protein n=1 Tax=Canavalia gladiata TaxID=3824 RepID=A0AAN9PPG4_CANGL
MFNLFHFVSTFEYFKQNLKPNSPQYCTFNGAENQLPPQEEDGEIEMSPIYWSTLHIPNQSGFQTSIYRPSPQ